MQLARAPKNGVMIGGKFYKGGQILPGAKSGSQVYWAGKPMIRGLNEVIYKRTLSAMVYLRGRIRRNIGKQISVKNQRKEHSKPGEFPKRISGDLWETLDAVVVKVGGDKFNGIVSSPMGYAPVLERPLNRSFLSRTFNAERANIQRKISSPRITKNKR